jgi:excisionase family DNA binding protein
MTKRSNSSASALRATEISVSTAARIAKCSPDTVLRWIEEGAVEAWRISRRGWWKIERESLLKYLKRVSGKVEFEDAANSARSSRAARTF